MHGFFFENREKHTLAKQKLDNHCGRIVDESRTIAGAAGLRESPTNCWVRFFPRLRHETALYASLVERQHLSAKYFFAGRLRLMSSEIRSAATFMHNPTTRQLLCKLHR